MEIKLDNRTLPKEYKNVKWQTCDDETKDIWKKGYYYDQNFFFGSTGNDYDDAFDVANWEYINDDLEKKNQLLKDKLFDGLTKNVKKLLNEYFGNDHEIKMENVDNQYFYFTITLKEGCPAETLFYDNNIEVSNIYWDRNSISCAIKIENIDNIKKTLSGLNFGADSENI